MANRCIDFGGSTNWFDGECYYPVDLNDTFDAIKSKKDAVMGGIGTNGSLSLPIGSVVAWAKSISGMPSLPAGWVECNGQSISDAQSPYNGITIPSLNSTNRFLRGATTSGTTGGAATHTHTIPGPNYYGNSYGNTGPRQPLAGSTTDPGSSLPPYYDVVWIMRIK